MDGGETLKKSLKLSALLAGIGVLLVLLWIFFPKHIAATPKELYSTDEIWVITDPHYLSPELHDQDVAFQKMQNTAAGKDLVYSKERMEALVAQVESERPKVLIVSGDMTFNGEYQSFIELAEFFKRIEALGTTVLVEPGNHDIADGWARKFQGNENYKIKQMTAADFPNVFAEYGYSEASSRDTHSLSYMAKPFTKLWFLMIDSNIYEKNGEGKGAPKTGGVIPKETLEWIDKELAAAHSAGVQVIPVMHHNLLTHHEFNPDGFVVDNASDLKAIFNQYDNVTLGFSGHIHTQQIATEKMSADRSYTEIVNGAFSVYPSTIGKLTMSPNDYHYQQTALKADEWAAQSGQTNPDLLHHQNYMKQVFDDSTRIMTHQSLYDESWYTKEVGDELSSVLAPLNLAYFSGDKIPESYISDTVLTSKAYQQLQTNSSSNFLLNYIDMVIKETTHANNQEITIPY